MRRGLIILVGECFRDGCSTSRIRDTERSLITQKEIDTYHDSNPAMDWNPLYKFAGREEVSTWRSEGHTLNMETFKGPY
jgi:hypothetical protein